MRFTRRTYRIAIRRAIQKEYELFCQPGNIHGWYLQLLHTARLQARKDRERP
jgi:hypothetical protein